MNSIKMIKTVGVDFLKGTAAALAAMVGLVVGGLITRLLGLPSVTMPSYINLTTLMPLLFLTLILLAILLGECFQRLYPRYWQRVLAIWLCHYLLYYTLNNLDGMLFTPIPHMSTSFVSSLFNALFPALVIAWLWKPRGGSLPAKGTFKYSSARKSTDWAWRFMAAWLVYAPVYYLMGRVVAIFTLHYYQDPSLNLGLALPPLGILMAMQVLRGALFLIAVLPVIYAWRGSRTNLWLTVGCIIFAQIAAQVVIQATWLPLELRIPHTIELFVDSFTQACLYALLLFVPASGISH